MINIVIPLAGKSNFFKEDEIIFPKPFVEICGKTMIEMLIDNYKEITNKQFIFILKDDDVSEFHLDEAIKVLDPSAHIITLKNPTQGMACSALLAIDYIDDNSPLIIANADQIFDINLNIVLDYFKDYDAGVIAFDSIHPRWAYVRVDNSSNVIEAVEKKPISKNAIAGFYYYKQGVDFIQASQKMIINDSHLNGQFYIAPTLNELILIGKNVGVYKIDNELYHTFYSMEKIRDYERIKNA
ncbi:glycosyltransferase family 2 protein [Campylobacter devanensis]|uniref:Glycosyltransferase, family 2 n=1 Tax=Campylobacter devanensis TaxID=3161138 RepID=A0A1X9SQG3_9BACT|nr:MULTISPECIES: glycosyltransferase family 2 protein [Campylobacter]ARQ98435.1 glycosyltransferase, family 2 [Campylobacter lanienae]SUX01440.1 capsular polysaccharide biosynthesis protein, nucleotidyltransferase [Campylobacter lanienae]